MRKLITTLVAVLGLATVGMANAIPITWNLSGVTYDDGSTATGSFIFDADTSIYTNVSIVTSPGVLPGSIYDTSEIVSSPFVTSNTRLNLIDNFGLADLTGETIISFLYDGFLTDAGGTLNLVTDFFNSFEGTCTSATCTSGVGDRTILTGGQIVAASVPEPSVLFLLGPGLIAMFGISRRKA